MKKIEAVVRSFKLDDIRDALMKVGVAGMTFPKSVVAAVRRVIQKPTVGPNMPSFLCPKQRSKSS